MRRIGFPLLGLIMAITPLAQSAQPPRAPKAAGIKAADPKPTVDKIIAKHVQTLGGEAALRRLKTQAIKGSYEEPGGATGSVEFYRAAPNKYLEIFTIGGRESVREAFNGTTGWARTAQRGLMDIPESVLPSFKRLAEFYWDIKLKELYTTLTLKGKVHLGDREAYFIEATPADGFPEKLYFDTETGLLLGRAYEFKVGSGREAHEYYFEDYREVDGTKLPYLIRRPSPSPFTVKVTEIKHNIPLDEAIFNKPPTQ